MKTIDDTATGRHLELAAGRFHYRDIGDPDAPPLLMLHGIMGHSREWDAMIDLLVPRFRVLIPDQRGHGRSDWIRPYTVVAMSDDVIDMMDRLEIETATLAGHSMGGMVGLVTTAREPQRVTELVTIDIGPDSFDPAWGAEASQWMQAMAGARYDTVDEALAEWTGNDLARHDLLHHYVEHCLVSDPSGRLMWRFDAAGLSEFFHSGTSSRELWAAADRVDRPTLVIRGEHSYMLSAAAMDEMVRRLGNAASLTIEGGAHDLGVEQPEQIAHGILGYVPRR